MLRNFNRIPSFSLKTKYKLPPCKEYLRIYQGCLPLCT